MENLEKYLEKNKNKFDELLPFTGSLFFSNKLILRKIKRNFGDEVLISNNALYKVLLPLYNHVLNQKIEHNGKPYLILDFFTQEKKIEIANSLNFNENFDHLYFYKPFTRAILEVDFSKKNNQEILVIFYKHLLLFIFKNCRITTNKLRLKENFEQFLDKEKKFNEKFPDKDLIEGFIQKEEKEETETKKEKHEFFNINKNNLISLNEKGILKLEEKLKNNIKFQDIAINDFIDVFKSKFIRLETNKERSLVSMMVLGGSGIGKTSLVKETSNFLFGEKEGSNGTWEINCSGLHINEFVTLFGGVSSGFEGSDQKAGIENFYKEVSKLDVNKKLEGNVGKIGIIYISELDKLSFSGENNFSDEEKLKLITNKLTGTLLDGKITSKKSGENFNLSNFIIILDGNFGELNSGKVVETKARIGFGELAEIKNNHEILENEEKKLEENLGSSFLGRLDGFLKFKKFEKDDVNSFLEEYLEEILENLAKDEDLKNEVLKNKDKLFEHALNRGKFEFQGLRKVKEELKKEVLLGYFFNPIPSKKFKKGLEKKILNKIL